MGPGGRSISKEVRHVGPRRAYSLLETTLSLGVISILLGSMGGLIVIAAKSLPNRARATDAVGMSSAALEQLSGELAQVVKVVSATDKSVEFTVADRDGDNAEETIRYQWSGAAGAPLERLYKGGPPVRMAESVTLFNLKYTVETIKTPLPSRAVASPEGQVAAWSGLALFSTTAESGRPVGQTFIPNLPAGTRSWTATRVRFLCQRAGTGTRDTLVQLRTTNAAGAPTDTVLAETTLANTALSAGMTQTEAVFPWAPALAPDQQVAIVVVCSTGCPSIRIGYATLSLALGTQVMWTHNGSSWNGNTLNGIPFEVHATTTQSVASETQADQLSVMTIKLRAGGAPELRTSVRLGNKPEVTP